MAGTLDYESLQGNSAVVSTCAGVLGRGLTQQHAGDRGDKEGKTREGGGMAGRGLAQVTY